MALAERERGHSALLTAEERRVVVEESARKV
jgi:hypothetical protein